MHHDSRESNNSELGKKKHLSLDMHLSLEMLQGCSKGVASVMIIVTWGVQVAGIMLGMFTMGFIADQIGRKWGSTMVAFFMFAGGILLTASGGPTLATWAWMFIIGEFVFGYAPCSFKPFHFWGFRCGGLAFLEQCNL
jgi:MFS family permease